MLKRSLGINVVGTHARKQTHVSPPRPGRRRRCWSGPHEAGDASAGPRLPLLPPRVEGTGRPLGDRGVFIFKFTKKGGGEGRDGGEAGSFTLASLL